MSTALVRLRGQMHLPIPPVWIKNPMASILEQLDTLVMRYIPQLEGVLIAHADARFLRALGCILGDSAFAEAPVAFSALVWRPEIGMELEGSITLSSPSHVSLLLHGTFNAAISAQHLPGAKYEFVYYDEDANVPRTDPRDRSVGFWRHKKSGARLGGEAQTLRFTVISMTVANHMLSLHGSLLKDPFSVAPPRPGSLSFDQALAEMDVHEEPAEEPAAHEAPAPPAGARKVRWDSEEASEAEERAEAAGEPIEVENARESPASADDYAQDADSDAEESDGDAPQDASVQDASGVQRSAQGEEQADAKHAEKQAKREKRKEKEESMEPAAGRPPAARSGEVGR